MRWWKCKGNIECSTPTLLPGYHVYTHSSTVGGSMHWVDLQTTNTQEEERRNTLCWLCFQSVSALFSLEGGILQHLLCAAMFVFGLDTRVEQKPTSLFGHGSSVPGYSYFHTFCGPGQGMNEPCRWPLFQGWHGWRTVGSDLWSGS